MVKYRYKFIMAKKLTKKQKIFVREIIRGSNATYAALAAYQTKNVNSAKVIGSRLLTNANVQEVINESLRSEGLSPSVLAKNIGNLANSTPQKVSGETVLKANIELLKLQGAYPDKKSFQVSYSVKQQLSSLSYQDLRKELDQINNELNEVIKDDPGYTQTDS